MRRNLPFVKLIVKYSSQVLEVIKKEMDSTYC